MEASASMSTASPVERPATAVDGVRLAVAGVDAVVPGAAGQDVLAGAAGDLIVAVETGEVLRAGAAGENVVERGTEDGLDVAADAVVVAGTPVAGRQVDGHADAGLVCGKRRHRGDISARSQNSV
jgi:hypothetical protein